MISANASLKASEKFFAKISDPIWGVIAGVATIPLSLVMSLNAALYAMTVWPASTSFTLRQGNLSFSGYPKSGDVVFAFLFVLTAFAFGLAAWALIKQSSASSNIKAIVIALTTSFLPLGISQLFGRATPVYPIEKSSLFVVVLAQISVLTIVASQYFFKRLRARIPSSSYVYAAQLALLGFLVPFASAGALSALSISTRNSASALLGGIGIAVTVIVISFGVTLIGLLPISSPIAFGLQSTFTAALVISSLLPPLLESGAGFVAVPGIHFSRWMLALVLILLAVILEAVFRVRYSGGLSNVAFMSAPIALMVVTFRATFNAPIVPADNYHFGELITPAVQWTAWGQTPYVDLFLPRGMVQNILPQLLNEWLNSGQATTLQYVLPVFLFGIVYFAHLVLRPFVGVLGATLAVLALGVANFYLEGDLLALALLVVVCAVAIKRVRWGIPGLIFAIGSALAILSYPMMGAVTFGIGGVVLTSTLIPFKLSKARIRYLLTNVVAVLTVFGILAISPVRSLIVASLAYLSSNAGSNSDAFGITYLYTWQNLRGIDWILATLFTVALPICIFLVFDILRSKLGVEAKILKIVVAVMPGLAVLLLASRYLGRIDPVDWSSRPTFGTIAVLAILLPSFIALLDRERYRGIFYSSLTIALVISLAAMPAFTNTNIPSSIGKIGTPDYSLSETLQRDIPRLGVGAMSQEEADYLHQVTKVNSYLDAGTNVLNLTNYGALTSYMNWRSPMKYLAPYNIESEASELQVIGQLQTDIPPLALVGPGQWFDGGSLSLRVPHLAMWVMENYTPFECFGNTWAISKTNDAGLRDRLSTICPSVLSQDSSSELWQASIGVTTTLAKSPAFWGRSTPPQLVLSGLSAVSRSPFAWMLGSNSTPFTALVFEAHCDVGTASDPLLPESAEVANISFGVDNQEFASTTFTFGNGKFVVPLSAFPALLGKENVRVAVEPNSSTCQKWSIQASSTDF